MNGPGAQESSRRSTRWSRSICTTQPERELKLQAIRIGDLGITAIPNEVFAITGLKLKAQSPFARR